MKKLIMMIFILIALVLGVGWLYSYYSNEGEFTKMSSSTISNKVFDEGNAYYFGYSFKWQGIGHPTIEKIEFIKTDGTTVAKDDDEIRIEPFIASSDRIGILDEATVIKEGYEKDLSKVKNYKIDENLFLVFRIALLNIHPVHGVDTIRITFKKFGVTRIQYFSYENGIIAGSL